MMNKRSGGLRVDEGIYRISVFGVYGTLGYVNEYNIKVVGLSDVI